MVILISNQACVRGGFNPAGEGGDSGRDGGGDGPVTDGVSPADGAADFGVQALIHGGSADPSWSGASTGAGATLDQQTVVLATLPTFLVKQAKLSPARGWATAVGHKDTIVIYGGGTKTNDSTRSAQIEAYDPEQDTFTSEGTLKQGLSMSAAALGPQGGIYLVKGLDKDHFYEARIHRFDLTSGKLAELPSTNLLTSNRHAVVRVGDLIHIFGGYGTGPIRHEIQTYNLTTHKVTTLASSMSSVGGGRTRLRACGAANGKIYLFGGTTLKATSTPAAGAQVVPDILAYTPTSGALVKVGSLPVALMNTAVGLMPDGKIYIVGGDTPTTSPACKRSDAVYRFDPANNQVSTSPTLKLPYPLSGAAFAVHLKNKKLYLFGGRDDSAGGLSDDVIELFPFGKQGEVLGPVLDTGGAGSVWHELDWDGATTIDTQITLAVRASDSPLLQGDTKPSWQPVSASPPVKSQLPGGRYLQWRATLNSSNSAVSPALKSVSLRYQRVK
jgi:Kelch motif